MICRPLDDDWTGAPCTLGYGALLGSRFSLGVGVAPGEGCGEALVGGTVDMPAVGSLVGAADGMQVGSWGGRCSLVDVNFWYSLLENVSKSCQCIRCLCIDGRLQEWVFYRPN